MNKNGPADFVEQLSRSRIYQNYQEAFGKTTRLPLELLSTERGCEISLTRRKYKNPLCAFLAERNEGCVLCLEVQRKPPSVNSSDTQTVRCFAGLTVTRVPVKLKESVIALLQTGQVFLRAPSANRFKRIATRLINSGVKVNLAQLETAYSHSEVVSPRLYHGVVQLLEIFAEHLALIANQIALQQANVDSPIVGRAKDYVASHQSEPIKLEQIARALNVSTFHFCRLFKKATGLTFVDYLNLVRIEKAKILLYDNRLRVSEIAYEVGFQTITHFNRIFRKLVGYAPTEYRSRLADAAKPREKRTEVNA